MTTLKFDTLAMLTHCRKMAKRSQLALAREHTYQRGMRLGHELMNGATLNHADLRAADAKIAEDYIIIALKNQAERYECLVYALEARLEYANRDHSVIPDRPFGRWQAI